MSSLPSHGSDSDDIVRRLIANAESIVPPDQTNERRQDGLPLLSNFVGDNMRTGIGRPIAAVTDDLLRISGGWPKRAGYDLFVLDPLGEPRWLQSRAELMAWMHSISTLSWKRSGDRVVAEDVFLAHLCSNVECFDAVDKYPHFPPISTIYYTHRELSAADGSCFDQLIARFDPLTPADGSLIESFFLTAVWGGPGGARPAFLVTGPDGDSDGGRGVGKSTLADMAAELLGGAIEISPNDDMGAIKKRLLSAEGRSRRIARIDNLKTHRFSWADLEGLITASTISGHQLYVGEGRRPNLLTLSITLNGANLSRDMAQRVIIIRLRRPVHSAAWTRETQEFVQTHRWQIFADMGARLAQGGVQ